MIMVSVPLSMTGALLALWLTGGTLNVYSQIGLVTLIGLITKHGILIVDFANQLQQEGTERTRRHSRGIAAQAEAHPDDDGGDDPRRHPAGASPRVRVPRAASRSAG